MVKLYQAEWCPFSHRIRAKLTELGVDYEAVNVSASAEKRTELKEITGNSTIPVLVDGEKVFSPTWKRSTRRIPKNSGCTSGSSHPPSTARSLCLSMKQLDSYARRCRRRMSR